MIHKPTPKFLWEPIHSTAENDLVAFPELLLHINGPIRSPKVHVACVLMQVKRREGHRAAGGGLFTFHPPHLTGNRQLTQIVWRSICLFLFFFFSSLNLDRQEKQGTDSVIRGRHLTDVRVSVAVTGRTPPPPSSASNSSSYSFTP